MRLAAIYNVWDSEELLEKSIRQIRPFVGLVIVVSQTVSNYGESRSEGKKECRRLLDIGLVDVIVPMCPSHYMGMYVGGNSAMEKETRKRQMGLNAARQYGADHFIFMDCDEMYCPGSFAWAKQHLEDNDYDGSACRLYTYYKKPTYRLEPMEAYYVPFIHKLKPDTVCGLQKYPVYADPTRRVNTDGKNFRVFLPEELAMHHYSYVRNDIGLKLRNSSARGNFGNIEELCAKFTSFQLGDPLVNFPNHTITEVEDIFNLSGCLK